MPVETMFKRATRVTRGMANRADPLYEPTSDQAGTWSPVETRRSREFIDFNGDRAERVGLADAYAGEMDAYDEREARVEMGGMDDNQSDFDGESTTSGDGEKVKLKADRKLYDVVVDADRKLRNSTKTSSKKRRNRTTGEVELDDSNELDINVNRLMEVGHTLYRGDKSKCYTPATGTRQVASGYLFGTGYYGAFMFMSFIALAAGAIIMSLYLADMGTDQMAKFQHSWVNVRWHVDGDKKWSHVWDAAAVCYGLTFFMAAAFYFAYIFSPSMHLANFRGFLHTGVFPMQAMDDIFSNIPLVVLILCVSGQDDFYEILYGTGIWALGHALFNVAQSYGYDHHFVPMRSTPKLTFLAGFAAIGLFWGTVIASVEYRTSDVKTEVNDGARIGIYTGFGIHMIQIAIWWMTIFYPGGLAGNIPGTYNTIAEQVQPTADVKPAFPSVFPLASLIKSRVEGDTVKGIKALISKYDAPCDATIKEQIATIKANYRSSLKKSVASGVAAVPLSFFVLQEDWQLFATKFIKWSTVRWAMSLAFKLAVTLSFVLGVALRLKVEANEAKVDA